MLDEQRAEMERLGYAIVSQSDSQVVGVRTRWFWDCFATSLTTVIFVRSVEALTAPLVEEEGRRMVAQARDIDPSSLPLGFQKGRAVVAIYVADQVAPDAQRLCNSPQPVRFATLFFPAALERSSGQVHYLRRTPMWGGVYFGKLRYPVQRLIDPANALEKEPISAFGSVLGAVMLLFTAALLCGCGVSLARLLLSLTQSVP
jgi:hypothetical protein